MSGNCAPVYNFYNCCDCNAGGTGKAQKFIWSTNATPTAVQDYAGNNIDALVMGGSVSIIDSDKKDFLNLEPLHVVADLLDLSILRFANNQPPMVDLPSTYMASVDLEVVVMDFMGNTLRTISLAPMNYKTLPNKVWTAIPLTGVAADLTIQPGELVAARVKFGAANPAVQLMFHLTGTGQLH